MEQTEREAVMREFRCGAIRILITTDLFANHIERQHLNFVINYELPNHAQHYRYRYD